MVMVMGAGGQQQAKAASSFGGDQRGEGARPPQPVSPRPRSLLFGVGGWSPHAARDLWALVLGGPLYKIAANKGFYEALELRIEGLITCVKLISRMEDQPVIVEVPWNLNNDDYAGFIDNFRQTLLDAGNAANNNLPLLPPQTHGTPPGSPARWMHIKLEMGNPGEEKRTTLAVRGDNVYFIGFRNQVGKWYEFGRNNGSSVHLITEEDSTFLGYDFQYDTLLCHTHEWTPTNLLRIQREALESAVGCLAGFRGARNNRERKYLAMLIVMFCESARMQPHKNEVNNVWQNDGHKGTISSTMFGYIQNWSTISRAILANQFPTVHDINNRETALEIVRLILNTGDHEQGGGGDDGRLQQQQQQQEPDQPAPQQEGDEPPEQQQPPPRAGGGGGGQQRGHQQGHRQHRRGRHCGHGQAMLEVFALRAAAVPVVGTVAIFDGRRGQVIYRGIAASRHGDADAPPRPSKDSQGGNLVLTGPHAAISADGCVAVEYRGNPGDEEEDAGGSGARSTMLWDPYDAKKQLEEFQYDTPLTKSITVSEGCHLEMSYAVLRSAVEATVQVDLLLSPQPEGLDLRMRLLSPQPEDLEPGIRRVRVHGEITAHSQLIDSSGDKKDVSILLFRRETQEALEVVSSFAGFPIPLSRSVLAWPCGSPLVVKVALHLQQPTSPISSQKGTSTSSIPSPGLLDLSFDDHEEDKIHLSPLEGIGYIRVSVIVTGGKHWLPIGPSTMSKMDLLADSSLETDLLVVHPRHLRFTVEPKKQWICSLLHITNDTDDEHVAFQLLPVKESPPYYFNRSVVSDILPPNTTLTYLVRLQKPPQNMDAFHMILRSCVRPKGVRGTVDTIFQRASEEIDEVTLKAVVCDPAVETMTSEPTQHGTGIKIIPGFHVLIDLHPLEPWILVSEYNGHYYIRIWNYETLAEVTSTVRFDRPEITSIKFIAPKGRFIAGDVQGNIHVYTCSTMAEVGCLKAHKAVVNSLAVHPSEPLVVLSASIHDEEEPVKLWKYGEDGSSWKCIQTFGVAHTPQYSMPIPAMREVKFSPNGDAFAGITVRGGQVQMFGLSSPEYVTTTLGGNKWHELYMECFDYFSSTGGDQLYMVTGSRHGIAHIWDLQTNQCITQVEGLHGGIWRKAGVVQSHLGRPILITVSSDNVISLYDCITYRCERSIDLKLGDIRGVLYSEKTESLVINYLKVIAVMAF